MTKIEPLPSADGCYTVWFRVWSDSGKFVPGEIRAGTTPDEVRFYCLEIPRQCEFAIPGRQAHERGDDGCLYRIHG